MFENSHAIEALETDSAVERDDPQGLRVSLFVDDAEIAELIREKRTGRDRDAYVKAALKIGVLALEQAGSRIDGDHIKRESDRLLESMATAMQSHRETVTKEVAQALSDYFDPQSGRLSQRVERLVARDGELETVIRNQVEGEGSALSKTMQQFLGETSPLVSLIDPSSEKGLAANLMRNADEVARQQREIILREFSLDNPGGALSRTLRELSEKHGAAGEALEQKISTVMAEFSLDREDSALSRLVNRVDKAQRLLSDEFSLDRDGSALARMRKELLEQIQTLSRHQTEFQPKLSAS